jgi:hypothetical protein
MTVARLVVHSDDSSFNFSNERPSAILHSIRPFDGRPSIDIAAVDTQGANRRGHFYTCQRPRSIEA